MSRADRAGEDQETPAAKPGAASHQLPADRGVPAAASTDRASETESLTVDERLADRFVDPKSIGLHDDGVIALLVRVRVPDQPGVLYTLTRVIFEHRANIMYVDISERRAQGIATYFELSDVEDL